MPTSSSTSSPAPATPAAATPRRRRRLLPSTSSGGGSTFPSPSSFSLLPPSPSPFHRFLPSPLRGRGASSVPFSWEHRPGIPKTPARSTRSSSKSSSKALPLPPSLLSRVVADPYASSDVVPADADYAALSSSTSPDELREMVGRSSRLARRSRLRLRRRPRQLADALADWLSTMSLYRSCKRAAACFAAKPAKPAA